MSATPPSPHHRTLPSSSPTSSRGPLIASALLLCTVLFAFSTRGPRFHLLSAAPPPPPAHGTRGRVVFPLYDPSAAHGTVPAARTVLENALTFVAIGDWGRRGGGGQEETAPALAAWAAATRAAFVISVGDNVYNNGVEPGATPAEADATLRAFFTDVYTQPALRALPWYVILGNHDYRGAIEPQLSWRGDDRWHPGLTFARSWPLTAAAAAAGGTTACLSVVFTDTTPLIGYYRTPSERKRLPGLSANLDAATPDTTAAWTLGAVGRAARECDAVFVVGHHPLYSPGEHADTPDLIRAYSDAFEGAGVDAYLSGHDHILAHSRRPGGAVEHVLTGAGSEVLPELAGDGKSTVFVATVRGFTVHSINATHTLHSYVHAAADTAETAPGLPGRVVFQVLRELRKKQRPASA